MSKILKQVRCGRLVCAVAYTGPSPGDTPRAREQKRRASTAARERLNARTAYQKLKRKLAANYDNGDLLLSLSFDDKHLPDRRDKAVRMAGYFLRRLSKSRAARGQNLLYIYVVEGFCPGGRPHIHVVVNATGDDVEEIRACWRYGEDVDVKSLVFHAEYTYDDLASYLTKEPRKWGHPVVGERMWSCSLNLTSPEAETETVPDYLTITPPPGAYVINSEGPLRNGFGEWAWLEYMLPYDPDRIRPKIRRRKKKKE